MATQRTSIFVEGVKLDLDKNVDIDFTYSIADIDNFDKRTTTFSKTISIPGTAHNNFLFGNYFDFTISNTYSDTLDNIGVNYNPLKKAFAKVTMDNIEIFAGVLRILEIKYTNGQLMYECALFGSLNSLFSAIGDKTLNELDLGALDHTYNWSTITATWDNPTNGYVYPLCEYGNGNSTSSSYGYKNFRPAINIKYLFDKIMQSAGYTYTDSFWSSNNLNKLVMLNNEDFITTYKTPYLANASLNALNITTSGTYYPTFDSSTASFLTIDTTTGGFSRIKNTSVATATFDLNYKITYTGTGTNAANDFELLIEYRDDSSIGTVRSDRRLISDFDFRSGGNTETIEGKTRVSLPTGRGVNLKLIGTLSAGSSLAINTQSSISVNPNAVNERIQADINDTIYGKSIPADGIKQSDFVKSVINMLNLYIITNPINEFDLIVTPYPDFYTNSSIDWSDKKSLDKGVSIKPPSEWTPKSYSFKYLDNTDFYSKQYLGKYNNAYGNYIYTTASEFAKDDNAFELIFALAPSVGNNNNNRIIPFMCDIDANGNFVKLDKKPTIAFFFGRKVSNASYSVTGTGSTINTTNFGLASHIYDPYNSEDGSLWDLAFGVPNEIYYTSTAFYPEGNLFNKFYLKYINDKSNKDAKLVTLYLLLNPSDIQSLDFRNPIKIDNSLYFLNKIDGYNPLGNELTKVELLKIA